MKTNSRKNDIFAEIASQRVRFRDCQLVQPVPVELEQKNLPLSGVDRKAIFTPTDKMNTKEQLQQELEEQRKYYAPFMKEMSPTLESYRSKIFLREFQWRIETEEDRKDFLRVLEGNGQWEKVKIPHYGEPLGKAATYYRTTLQLSQEQLAEGVAFICFKAVDYKAHVFMNNTYIGSHEGLFAPFEFDFTAHGRVGENTLVVKVENDFIFGTSPSSEEPNEYYGGDKLYAATGIGYDDPQRGWHHCPPGMGIYQDVYVEIRPGIHIRDIFVRPIVEEKRAEAWIEVYNCDICPKEIALKLSVYGQNFEKEVFSDLEYRPSSSREVGVGDSLTEAELKAAGTWDKPIDLAMEKGINYLRIPFELSDMRLWELDTPWLYQLQVKVIDNNQEVIDTAKRQFGMRSFSMDEESEHKGAFYLNGRQIRLRGANTMGHEQQCVAKKDWNQLRDDILLAKICNMNFLRITQRPVQQEVYDFCDMLGLMTQTDLPLFGVLRRNQFCEAIRQVEEMESVVRHHSCNIMVSYINEPFPNSGNKPHRHVNRDEMMEFFKAADIAIRLNNPDRVIKAVDGDYDPPGPGLPDNHCYCGWYNGHGVDIGKLHKGYWQYVKPGWHYGCGEFGSEGLDPVNTMREYYPKEWLPQNAEEERVWSPSSIIGAQTGMFHYFFYETPNTLKDWVNASHKHQAWATKVMTEAFRRDYRMNTFAIHLFIDAFPSGWMKAIMDVKRQPKSAYFAYRDALIPLMVNLRTDRYTCFAKEEVNVEAWICNDLNEVPENTLLHYQIEMDGEILASGKSEAKIPLCSSKFQGFIRYKVPDIESRKKLIVRLGLLDETGEVLHDTAEELEIFPKVWRNTSKKTFIIGSSEGKVAEFAVEMGLDIDIQELSEAEVILIDNYEEYLNQKKSVMKVVKEGAKAIFMELPPGIYDIAGSEIQVKASSMMPFHFVSRDTGHRLVEGFQPDDFRLWYNPAVDHITPLLENTFIAPDFEPILTSGNTDDDGQWGTTLAVAEKKTGKGSFYINQIKLVGRTSSNPVAQLFASRIIE